VDHAVAGKWGVAFWVEPTALLHDEVASVRPQPKDPSGQVLGQTLCVQVGQASHDRFGIVPVGPTDDFLQRSLGGCDEALSKPPAERICPPSHLGVVRELAHEGLEESLGLVEVVGCQRLMQRG
jgi:hypothetical protein